MKSVFSAIAILTLLMIQPVMGEELDQSSVAADLESRAIPVSIGQPRDSFVNKTDEQIRAEAARIFGITMSKPLKNEAPTVAH